MMKGEIYKREGLYYLVVDDSNDVGMLKERIRVLEEENKKLREKSESQKSVAVDSWELEKYKKWLDEANKAYEELEATSEEKLDSALKLCFDQMARTRSLPILQAPTFKEFKKRALGMDTSDTDSDFVDLPF